MGLAGIFAALGLLAILLTTIVAQGYTAFVQTTIKLDIDFDPAGDRSQRQQGRERASRRQLRRIGPRTACYELFPDVEERQRAARPARPGQLRRRAAAATGWCSTIRL